MEDKLLKFMELAEEYGFTYTIHTYPHLLDSPEHKAFINYYKAHTRAKNYYNKLVKKANHDKV